jgi:hypothetical protein
MKLYGPLYIITLITGALILAGGITMKILRHYSGGWSTGRFGEINEGTITWTGAIIIGILFLILSAITYRWYKQDMVELENME